MTSFLSDLVVRIVDDSGPRPLMELTAPLAYFSDTLGPVHVPAGFVFDGASIPTGAMGIVGWPGLRSACLHDWLLEQPHVRREHADDIFREALGICGVPDHVAAVMWAAVALRTARLENYPAADDATAVGA